MTMATVLRDGNSLSVVLPPEVVEHLELQEGDALSMVRTEGTVTVRKDLSIAERRREAVTYTLTHHARTLALLANR